MFVLDVGIEDSAGVTRHTTHEAYCIRVLILCVYKFCSV